MAVKTGRGFAAIEYPTGMNQNGDPSQAWIKVKPDGRIDVFAGTSDIGNGSKTIQSQIVAETIGVPYEWITYDNSNTDSSPVCTGTFASRATFVAGKAAEKAAENVRQKILEIAGKELEIDPSDLEIIDGEVVAKGAPQKKISVPDVAAAATWTYGELITGTGAQLKPFATIVEPTTGKVDLPPHSAISYASCAAEVEVDDETGVVTVTRLWQCYDVGKSINPTLVEGQIEGGAVQGLGLGILENCYPYYPSVEHRGSQFGSYLAPGMEDLPQIDTIIIENPSSDGPYGAKGIGEMANNAQPPAIATAVFDAVGVWVTELPVTPERVLRALQAKAAGAGEPKRDGKTVVFDAELSVNVVGTGITFGAAAGWRSQPDGELALRDLQRCGALRHLSRRRAPPDCGRPGVPRPRRLRGGYDGRAPQPRAHGAGDARARGIGDDDDRRSDERARERRHVHRQPRRRARALLGARRHVHRGARPGAARPHRRSRARSRARRPERVAARRALIPVRDPERQGRARHRRQSRHRRCHGGAFAGRRLARRDRRACQSGAAGRCCRGSRPAAEAPRRRSPT
jgi:hypothetical protein